MNFPGTLGFLKILLVVFFKKLSLEINCCSEKYFSSIRPVICMYYLQYDLKLTVFHKKDESIVDSVWRSLFSKLIIDWMFKLLHCLFILILIITTFNLNNLEKTDGISKEFSFKTRPVKWILMWFLTFCEKRHKITQQV